MKTITKNMPEPINARRPMLPDLQRVRSYITEEYGDEYGPAFDDLMGEHDKRIRREALTATDEELAVMEAAFDASINDREDDGIGAMGIAMEALAKSRERES